MSKEHTKSFVYGFAGVALMFGVMLLIAGVHNPDAAAETAVPAHFGVTDADLDMNRDGHTGVFQDDVEARARKFIDLGASVSD